MKNFIIAFLMAVLVLPAMAQESEQETGMMVRLSRITVHPAFLAEYNACLKEEIEASMRLEPGVLTLYAVAEKEQPNKVTILEIYADQAAYEHHVKTPHFRKYKEGTSKMVKQLELIDATPLIPGLKIK